MEGKVKIGKVTRLHGFKGELSLKLEPSYAALFEGLDHIFLEIDKKATPFFIDAVRFTSQGYALVFFDGVDDQSSAEQLRGASVWMDEQDIPEDFEDPNDVLDLVGYEVIDTNDGALGAVSTIVEHPGNSFLVIDREDGEILIPMHERIVKKIDRTSRSISIEAPEGLISLNLD